MRILFDLLYYSDSRHEGVRIYGIELIRNFIRYADDVSVGVLCWDMMKDRLAGEIQYDCDFVQLPYDNYSDIRHHGSRFLRKKLPDVAALIREYDVCLCTFANDPVCLFPDLVKYVGVIHDMQMFRLIWKSEKRLRAILTIFRWRMQYRLFSRMVTISKQSYDDIVKFCGIKPVIIPNSIKSKTTEDCRPLGLSSEIGRYILDINTFHEYKNAANLICAFAEIHAEIPGVSLYLKGNVTPYYNTLRELVNELGLEDSVILDTENRSDEEINWLYRHSEVFVSPSRMEGFGYTPVEAVINKIPTLVSDIPVFHEVDGDCVDYFDPCSVPDMARALLDSISNRPSVQELDRRASTLWEKYSPERQVGSFVTLLRSLDRS